MAKVQCPHCRRWHDAPGPKQTVTFQSVVKQPHKSAASAAIPMPTGYKETPVNMPTLPSHIYVPLADMLVSAALLSPAGILLGVGGAWLVATSGDTRLTTAGYVVSGLAGWGAMFWLSSIHQWFGHRGFYRGLLFTAEEYFQADIDGDGNIGEPEPLPEPKVLKVEVVDNHGIPRKLQDLPIDLSRFKALAELVISGGKGFSERVAGEAGISQKEFGELRRVMVERGWAAWKHPTEPRQGASLSREGNNVLRATLSLDSGQERTHVQRTNGDGRIGKYVPIE